MSTNIHIEMLLLICSMLIFSIPAFSGDSYSPYVEQYYPAEVYWGDTHLHTNLSMDAYIYGNRLGPDEAYRFAKGEAVTANNGMKARLHRPLDFLVIADHAINMGVINAVEAGDPSILKTDRGKRWATWLKKIEMIERTDRTKSYEILRNLSSDGWGKGQVGDDKFSHSRWKEVTALADQHNDPGRFTALIGYEWTSMFSLHRVVVFKDDANKASQITPLAAYDNFDPENLWEFLEEYESATDGEVLAIPHNSNLSSGVMFALQEAKGNPLSKHYANTRNRWEPLLEVTQIKGDSETHPVLSPTDEFADYETMVEDNMSPKVMASYRSSLGYTDYENWYEKRESTENNSDWMRPYEYARSALKLGLSQQAKLGINPFKFGMIGSTDSHISLATADESNFWGKLASAEPQKNRVIEPWHPILKAAGALSHGWKMNAGGYAAVWAKENTREALFAAMKRKEVYASTGPRMTVRFFGGWDYQFEDAFRPDLAEIGYAKGVPMGGDLTNAWKGKVPKFLIRAVKDPDGANLDRVQVIKGWHDKKGELHEKIYNVALSDDRKENSKGKIKPIGNTVNVEDAFYTNSIGDPELAVVWQDPDFNEDELTFYYVRVLEIPTPRWTAYDAKFFGLTDIPDEVPMVTQERAYTSPIWYSPGVRHD